VKQFTEIMMIVFTNFVLFSDIVHDDDERCKLLSDRLPLNAGHE